VPASLKFILLLLGAGVLLAIGAGTILHRQTEGRARIVAEELTHGDSANGKRLISYYGCSSCHEITGVPAARGAVGPSLSGIGSRALIAGRLANEPNNMFRWVRAPQEIAPGTAMPDTPMSDRDARDIAAYLYTLQQSVPDK